MELLLEHIIKQSSGKFQCIIPTTRLNNYYDSDLTVMAHLGEDFDQCLG